jgi:hypothetical protein
MKIKFNRALPPRVAASDWPVMPAANLNCRRTFYKSIIRVLMPLTNAAKLRWYKIAARK